MLFSNLIVNICSVPPHQKIRHSHHAMKTNALTLDGWRFSIVHIGHKRNLKNNQHFENYQYQLDTLFSDQS